jgi:hypothetical protein
MPGANINPSSTKEFTVYDRTKSDILKITEDKLRLKLHSWESSIKNKFDVFCYAGIVITIIITLLTADFKKWFLSAELWKAIFIVSLTILIILIIRSLIVYIKKRMDIDSIIRAIKEE